MARRVGSASAAKITLSRSGTVVDPFVFNAMVN
jgi:hypothetical protein